MKSFYGGTYIGKEVLKENNIYYPIRLEYYKIAQEENNKLSYGIEVVKTEYKKEEPEVERNIVENITIDEDRIIEILEKFKNRNSYASIFRRNARRTVSKQKRVMCIITLLFFL